MIVKKLKWEEYKSRRDKKKFLAKTAFHATTPFGWYIIQNSFLGGYVWGFFAGKRDYEFEGCMYTESLEEAKELAQSDFENGVNECVENHEKIKTN